MCSILSTFDQRPIAIFDSGLGGLSVLACALELAPRESFVYLADLANAPYGERSVEDIRSLVSSDVSILLKQNVKALVVACNTATACSVALLRRQFHGMPIIGMEPALKVAAMHCPGKAAVLATPATLSLGMFDLLRQRCAHDVAVLPVPCPGLAHMIDEDASPEALRDYLYERLDPSDTSVTSIVLGCTHYVLIAPLIRRFYPGRAVLSGNEGAVRHMLDVLAAHGLCAQQSSDPRVRYLCTAPIDQIQTRMELVTARAQHARVWENFFPDPN